MEELFVSRSVNTILSILPLYATQRNTLEIRILANFKEWTNSVEGSNFKLSARKINVIHTATTPTHNKKIHQCIAIKMLDIKSITIHREKCKHNRT